MIHSYLVCIAFLVFVLVIDADSSRTGRKGIIESALQPNSSKGDTFQTTNEIDIPVARLLRTNKTSDERQREERTGGISVSAFEKFKIALMSSKITPEKLEKWLEKGKSADAAFLRFHLDKRGNFLFNKPHFAVWVDYADKLSAKFPEMSAISTLTKHYGDDFLYRIIQAGKKRADMKNLALKLETEQMQRWLGARKDPDELFRLFHLDLYGRTVFEHPEFMTWAKYVDDLTSKHPEEPTWMYSTLTKYFKDDVLFKMTNVAKDSTQTKTIATKVEDDWIAAVLEKHKTPDQLLQNLGLGKNTDELLIKVVRDDALIITWVKYMKAFNKRYPAEKTTMLETFTRAFDDDGVTKMLHTAKSESWWTKLATKMETDQLKMWLNSGKTTDDVFNLLKLDKEWNRYHFRDKQLLSTWVSYINVFIEKNPDLNPTDIRLNQILNMAKKYASLESTATKIQNAKITTYRTSNESPGEVFTLLGLMDEGDHILSTSQFKSWMKYVEDFNNRNQKEESWFRLLNHAYDIEGMLNRARKTASTAKIDKMLENEWVKFWVGKQMSPKYTFQHLSLKSTYDDTLTSPAFKIWTKYLNAFNKQYPKEKVTMIEGLRANYNDINMLTIFEQAKKDPTTEKLVIDLENALINKWIVEKKSSAYLHKQLGHVKSSDDMIQRYVKKSGQLKMRLDTIDYDFNLLKFDEEVIVYHFRDESLFDT
ncbi:Avirulence (Avh) protein [Phytophthora megakarya]|uniref:Avirulence (Avh) protein n=1 Tax=Phytophthora megakarya TaxID=4795 RepID=A0A225V7K5_9STRA|nr:Avirulence (Avh) protein [Phytophthora megakarya]